MVPLYGAQRTAVRGKGYLRDDRAIDLFGLIKVRYSVMPCVAVCCNVLQLRHDRAIDLYGLVKVRCILLRGLRCAASRCIVLQCVALSSGLATT